MFWAIWNKTQGMHCVRIVISESCNFINYFKGKNTVLIYLWGQKRNTEMHIKLESFYLTLVLNCRIMILPLHPLKRTLSILWWQQRYSMVMKTKLLSCLPSDVLLELKVSKSLRQYCWGPSVCKLPWLIQKSI